MNSVSPLWPTGEPWRLPMPDGTLYHALARAAHRNPVIRRPPFYGATLSYGELRHRVDAMAGFLQHVCGVKRGDRVLIALQNSPQYVIAYYAVMRADAVIVPVNPMNKTEEIAYLAADSGATVAIVGSELCEIFAPLLGTVLSHAVVAHYRDEVPTDTLYALPACVTQSNQPPRSPGWFRWQEAIAQAQSPAPMTAAPDDLVIMPYTSGTTGKPKACMHTHRSALFTAGASGALQAWPRRCHDRLHAVVPRRRNAGIDECRHRRRRYARADGPMGQGSGSDLFEAHG